METNETIFGKPVVYSEEAQAAPPMEFGTFKEYMVYRTTPRQLRSMLDKFLTDATESRLWTANGKAEADKFIADWIEKMLPD